MARHNNKKSNLVELGALWEQQSKDGLEYLTGVDSKKNRIIAFWNDKKKNDKEPDIRIYYSND